VPADTSEELTVIRFAPNLNFGNVWSDPVYEAFIEEHPEIAVEFVELQDSPDGRYAVLPESLAASAAEADCFAWQGPPAAHEAAATLDLNPLIDTDPTFPRDDYSPLVLQPFQQQGRLTGLPYDRPMPVLLYNKELFDAVGLPHPTNESTYQDVLAAAEALTTDQQVGLFNNGRTGLAFFLDGEGVALTKGSGALLQPRFTEPEVVEALERYVEITRRITPHNGAYNYSELLTGAEVADIRQTGMMFLGGPDAYFVSPYPPAKFGVVMLRNTRAATYFQPGGLLISTGTQHADACWTWIQYLVETGLGSAFNARRSMREELQNNPEALPGTQEVMAAYETLLEQPYDTSSVANFLAEPTASYWLAHALNQVFREGSSLAAELTKAQSTTEQYLLCVQSREPSRRCALQVDPTFRPETIL